MGFAHGAVIVPAAVGQLQDTEAHAPPPGLGGTVDEVAVDALEPGDTGERDATLLLLEYHGTRRQRRRWDNSRPEDVTTMHRIASPLVIASAR